MIRSATQNDRLAIGHIYCEGWKAGYRGLIPDAFLDGLTDESCAPPAVPSSGVLVFEAEDGLLTGVVRFGPMRVSPDGHTGEIQSIYVLPDHWRMGAGKALFEGAALQLRKEGYTSLFIWALTGNRRAAAFYARMGMTACDCRFIEIGGKTLPETGWRMLL